LESEKTPNNSLIGQIGINCGVLSSQTSFLIKAKLNE